MPLLEHDFCERLKLALASSAALRQPDRLMTLPPARTNA